MPHTSRRPNILFIHTDSWDGRALGNMARPGMVRATPNVDQLARDGVQFTRAYCTHPICCPSRANMWSGQYTFHCESWNNHKGLQRGTETFKDRLEQAGYIFASEEGGFGKHDYWSGRHTHLARVSAWTGPSDIRLPVYREPAPKIIDSTEHRHYQNDWSAAEQAIAFLREHSRADAPMFCYVGLGGPHPSFTTTRYWMDRIDVDEIDIPVDHVEDHPVMEYQRVNKNWQHGFLEPMIRRTRAIYAAMCAEVDGVIGMIRQAVDDLGLADNTIIIFASDHGEIALEHRNWYKMSMYEGAVRVPWVVAGPGIEPGRRVDELVSLIDLYPTLMDLAGVEGPANLDGESLAPVLADGKTPARPYVLATHTGTCMNTTATMLRTGPWKYIAYPGYPPQLFNLQDDPGELNDLARRDEQTVARLDSQLRELVDYQQMHDRCQTYNRARFHEWREQAQAGAFSTEEYSRLGNPATTYDEIMANIYLGYSPEHEQQINAWLDA